MYSGNKITHKGLTFEKCIETIDIDTVVEVVASKINKQFENVPSESILFVGLLNGVLPFAIDLVRKVNFPVDIQMAKVSSYQGTQSTNKLEYGKSFTNALSLAKDKQVVLLDDIADTGLTMTTVTDELLKAGATKVYPVALFYKEGIYKKRENVELFAYGLKLDNSFVIGYGLDYDGFGRNLPCVYKKLN